MATNYTTEQTAAAVAHREARLQATQAFTAYRDAVWTGVSHKIEAARIAKEAADAAWVAAGNRLFAAFGDIP